MRNHFAVDFETFYDRDYSLKNMNTWSYVYHDKFDAYLVAIWGDAFQFVGHPKEFDWMKLDGATLLMHNAHFDALVLQRLQEKGIVPRFNAPFIYDTADLASYLKAPRDLKNASRVLLGVTPDKAMRDYMKGKTYAQAKAEGKEEDLLKYGGSDARLTFELWREHGPKWPDNERRLSILNREAGFKGVYIDEERVALAARHLKDLLFKAEAKIPWEWEKTPLAWTKIREECRAAGLPVPSSFSQDSEECIAWENKYGDQYPWIAAVRDWRRVNMLLKKVETLAAGIRPDGSFSYQTKYFGAHTGRMSGDGKFNMQNLPKFEMFGVDLRAMILPRPGNKLVLIDYAQVEARALKWIVGDKKFIQVLQQEGNLYQAGAKVLGRYQGNDLKRDDKHLYAFMKVYELGCGYGCGPSKLRFMAETVYDYEMTEEEAEATVAMFRRLNPRIVRLWRELQNLAMLAAANKDDYLEIELPSGRSLYYYKPVRTFEGLKAMFTKDDPKSYRKIYGGLLTENLCQAMCRDLLREGWVALVDHGFHPLFTVHDEFVLEMPESQIDPAKLKKILLEAAPWAKGMPVDVEINVTDHYTK